MGIKDGIRIDRAHLDLRLLRVKGKQFRKYTSSKLKFKENMKLLLSGGDNLVADNIAKVKILNVFLLLQSS